MAAITSATLVTFDFEGKWGMARDEPYNLHEATNTILDILRHHNVSAMFFVVGQLVEEEPELIASIAKEGHAIGVHGYRHERLDRLTSDAMSSWQIELQAVCSLIEPLTGSSPVAFRAPYLLWPEFSHPAVSKMLAELGFLWTSNRHVRFAEQLFLPDWGRQLAKAFAGGLGALSDRRPLGSVMLALLNGQYLMHDPAFGSSARCLRWLLGAREPFERFNLIEVAIGAPLECDLVGLPLPSELTSDSTLDFATERLIRGNRRRGNPYVLTFHDWIIGTGNRRALLDNVLSALRRGGPMLEAQSWMPKLGERLA